nr:uncharacterized protein LOC127329503 [Lolium perenne]
MPPPKGSQPIRGRRPGFLAASRTQPDSNTSCRTRHVHRSTLQTAAPPAPARRAATGTSTSSRAALEPAPSPGHEPALRHPRPSEPGWAPNRPPRRSPNEPRPPPAASADLPPRRTPSSPQRRQLDPRNHRHLAACRPSRENLGGSKKRAAATILGARAASPAPSPAAARQGRGG